MAAVKGKPLIVLKGVRFRWQPRTVDVLNIEDFSVYAGEKIFIQGASGSGKTTLLGLIGGVIEPQQGSVRILDTTINALSGTQRDNFRADHIGFIFQMFNLIPYLSLIDNVILPCRFSASRHQRATARSESLEREAHRLLHHLAIDVNQLSGRPVTELSMGQQQRVAAARALIGSPALIIADEPTSALDHDVRNAFLDLLFREIDAVGAGLLFVSHDSSLQARFDRTVALSSISLAAPENRSMESV